MSNQQKQKKAMAAVGVILVTHVDYGAKLLEAAQFILGQQEDVATVSVDNSQDVEETVERLTKAMERLDRGAGVVILTDMFGGTPTNLSLSLLNKGKVEVVTGVNLPMLLKVLSMRDQPLGDVALAAKESGLKGIVVAGQLLRKKVSEP